MQDPIDREEDIACVGQGECGRSPRSAASAGSTWVRQYLEWCDSTASPQPQWGASGPQAHAPAEREHVPEGVLSVALA